MTRSAFARDISRYWPAVDERDLAPDYAGIRPKMTGPIDTDGEKASSPNLIPKDFNISGPRDHGRPNLVCLFGIESPGFTSSFSLADMVANKLLGKC
jgi:L-2-hydroxyglutarate oxidase LhgO